MATKMPPITGAPMPNSAFKVEPSALPQPFKARSSAATIITPAPIDFVPR